ncbi:hypothetical protein JL107_15900 [Nakamurella flavida]|uniref:Uncharacterized protein n=1 Tax=Nakamurella flavida TaxID=363630 RepID=A0A939C794_9ACTN|nr:hypothetical protein [Nakamurella flavida]MBM9477932.1 hypothetical protein [Nakamurella flavida]MDP9778352.1 hypothetical protein [Nakamurella flavida]
MVHIEMHADDERRFLLRADDGQGPLVDITDLTHPRPVDMDSLGLTKTLRTRLRDWSTTSLSDRDTRWQMAGGSVASDLEDELDGPAVHYARGRDDPSAPAPQRPPGGGRTSVFSDPPAPSAAYSSSLTITFGAPSPEPPQVLATHEDDADLAELRRRVVEPVIRSLLTDDEYRSTRVYWQSDAPDAMRVDVVAAEDASIGGWLTWTALGNQTVEQIAAKFASDMEDWVCETRFGWGQQRRAVYVIPPPLR